MARPRHEADRSEFSSERLRGRIIANGLSLSLMTEMKIMFERCTTNFAKGSSDKGPRIAVQTRRSEAL